MSHNVWSDVVPFIIHRVWEVEYPIEPEEVCKLAEPASWADDEGTEEDREDVQAGKFQLRGWTLDLSDGHDFGKRKNLYAPTWRKDDFKVYMLNESDASNAGYYEISPVAETKESLEEFIKDFADLLEDSDTTIEENDAAQQSG